MVAQLRRGVPWAELAGDMIDTRDVPGMIHVVAASRSYHGEHFFAFMPARVIHDAIRFQLPENSFVTLFEPATSTSARLD